MGCVGKNLLYITSQYPNVHGDTAFIATEIKYLSDVFDKIIVLSHGDKDSPCVDVPKNVFVKYFEKKDKHKLLVINILSCIPLLFDVRFWKELPFLFKKKKKLSCLKLSASFLRQALDESKEIEGIIKCNDISIVYTFWYYYSTLACQIAIKHLGISEDSISMYTRTHGFDLYEYRNTCQYQPFKIQMDKKINKIFFISKQGMEYYKKLFATKQDNVYILHYLGSKNSLPFVPRNYTDTIELLSISNLVPVKRVHLIILSLLECVKLGIKINWTHIGSGPEAESLISFAEEKLAAQNFVSYKFLGSKTNEEVMEYYKKSLVDLFVNMSESEGLPVSMMEAMSFGVPVIAPDVGGIKEIVDKKSGWLLSADLCNQEFVQAVKEWSTFSIEQKRNKSKMAYEKWREHFNEKNNYNKFMEEFL